PGSLLRASATLVARGLETPVTSTTRSMATRSLPGDKNNPGLHRRGGPGGDRGPTAPVDEPAAAACEAQPRLVQKISYARSKIRSRTKQYLRLRGVSARDAAGMEEDGVCGRVRLLVCLLVATFHNRGRCAGYGPCHSTLRGLCARAARSATP